MIRLQRVIAFVSLFLFVAKLWAWFMTGSVTILTDALESTVNVLAGFIGWYSISLAAKPRDLNHPYGHGKIEFVSAAVEGSLIIIAALFIFGEAVDVLIHPRAIKSLDLGIILIAATGLVNFILGTIAVKKGIAGRSATLEAAGRHLRTDAYSTLAIIIGLIAVRLTKFGWLDSAVAMGFAGFILVSGYKVLRKSLAGIMDEADPDLLKRVIDLLQQQRRADWIDLHNLRVIQYGAILHIDAHMTLPYYFEVRDADREIHTLETLITNHFGGTVELFIHVDGCEPFQCRLCAMPACPVRQEELKGRVEWTLENLLLNARHGKEGGG
jgi:cation diffusion facilitator family transporter